MRLVLDANVLVAAFVLRGVCADRLLRTRLEVAGPVAPGAQVCRDPGDDVVLGTAVAGRCDAVVTGARDRLDLVRYRAIEIISPRGFWSFESRRPSGG